MLLRAAREHGAAVVVLDHVTKQEEASRYARGSGAKLQLVDVAFMVEPITPFRRDQGGLLKLTVSKDRRGYLARAHHVRVEADGGRLALSISEAGAGEDGLDDPDLAGLDLAPAARKLLAGLRARRGEPLSASELVDWVKQRFGHGLGRQTVSTALNDLAKRGLVDGEEDHSRYGAKRWWAL